MKATDSELVEMFGYAALSIRSFAPGTGRLRQNCWCINVVENGHERGCEMMRGAVKAWREQKKVIR